RDQSINYYASDVAAGMLQNSNIPAERQMVGTLHEVKLPDLKFDYVFMLGVSTYLSVPDFEAHLKKFKAISERQQTNIIISFSNKYSLDHFMRIIFRPIMKLLDTKKAKVISQSISIQTY